ncbi:MAG TPA: MATE family efflux transporter, partial [Bacilli bacterium]
APIASIYLGEGKKDAARQTMMNSFVMLILFGLLLTAVTLLFDTELLYLFGGEEEVMDFAKDYLDYYATGTVFTMISIGMTAYITAQGFSKIAMLTVSIGAFLNIVFDPLFIYSFALGVKGAAIATVISQAVSAFFVLAFLSGKRPLIRLGFRNFRFQPKIILAVMFLGISPFIMNATESLVQIVFNNQIGKYAGENYTLYINLITIFHSVMTVIFSPLSGFVQGAAPLISYNYGCGRFERIREAVKMLIKTCLFYTLAFYLLIFLFPNVFVIIFNDNPDLLAVAPPFFRIFFLGISIFGIQVACQNVFMALRQSVISLLLALLRKVILLVPFTFLLPRYFGIAGVYYAEPAADILAVITTFITFKISFEKILEQRMQELTRHEFGK